MGRRPINSRNWWAGIAGGELVPPYNLRQVEPTATDLRVPGGLGSDASALVLEKPWPPLWIVLAVLAALLAIIEWCLYQRRWTN